MKQLFFIASLSLLILATSSAQTQKTVKNTTLPTEQQWKVAIKPQGLKTGKNANNTPPSQKNTNLLPTEAQWIQASNSNRRPKS